MEPFVAVDSAQAPNLEHAPKVKSFVALYRVHVLATPISQAAIDVISMALLVKRVAETMETVGPVITVPVNVQAVVDALVPAQGWQQREWRWPGVKCRHGR